MKVSASGKIGFAVFAAAFVCGCADNGTFGLATASVTPDATLTAQKTDPVCVSLASQISTLRSDGSIDRLEKAAEGKGTKVQVKRETLQKQADLNRLNADFQTRCGPVIPRQVAAQPSSTATPTSQNANAAPPAAPTTKQDVN